MVPLYFQGHCSILLLKWTPFEEDSMATRYDKGYEKAIVRILKAREQYFFRTAVALEHASQAQSELISLTTDTMTRGYFGILNGTTSAITQTYAGFLDGFSRAWDRVPKKAAEKKSSGKGRGGKKR
jgi:hypothetical protein